MSSALQKLFTAFSTLVGRYAPALITLLVLAGGFYFYFNVIVSRNEANMEARNFRGLNRIAGNLTKKIDDYIDKNSSNFLKKWIDPNSDPASLAFLKRSYQFEEVTLDSLDTDDGSLLIKFFHNWQLVFVNKVKDTTKSGRVIRQLAPISFDRFIEPLLRRDLFPYFFFAINDTIVFDELNISHQSVASFLPRQANIDTGQNEHIIQTGQVRQVAVGGKQFRLFYLPFFVEGKYKFMIGGYMPQEKYLAEQKYIPIYAILWLVIGILLVALMFPLLKVFLMNRSEQLRARNTISSYASVHILSSVLALVVINIFVYFSIVLPLSDEKLKALADNIETSFTGELNAALNEMDTVLKYSDAKAPGSKRIPFETFENNFKHSKRQKPGYIDSAGILNAVIGSTYPYFKHIVWVDSTGMQKYRWTTDDFIPGLIDVSDRDYFQAIKNGNLWRRGNDKPFYLTSISSWISPDNLAIISRPVTYPDSINKAWKPMLMSLSGPFRSLFGQVLPEDFGFCVLNETADVLFHYDERRNLNENLAEECNNNTTLLALLQTRSKGYFGSRYSSSNQRFYVKPLSGTPYYIVTYRDMKMIWSEDLDIVSACSILILLNLIVILVAVLIIQLVKYRHSLLERQSSSFTWLQPDKNLTGAYRRISIFYCYSMVLQLVLFLFYPGYDQLCLLGIAFSFDYILISYAYYNFAILKNTGDPGTNLENKKAFFYLELFYAAVALVFSLNLGWTIELAWFLASQLLLIVPGYLVTHRELREKLYSRIKKSLRIPAFTRSKQKVNSTMYEDYGRWYTYSVFGFIAATAIIPSTIFYFLTFKEERLETLKYRQLAFAYQLLTPPRQKLLAREPDRTVSFHTPYYYHCFKDSLAPHNRLIWPGNRESKFQSLYKTIKPSFSTYSKKIEYLRMRSDSIQDFNWQFFPATNLLALHYKIHKTKSQLADSSAVSIYSTLESGPKKTTEAIRKNLINFIFFIAVIILMLLGLFSLLSQLIRKLFFHGYNKAGHVEPFDCDLIHSLPDDEHIFVYGLVNSGKYEKIQNCLASQKLKELDLARPAGIDPAAMLSEKQIDATTNPSEKTYIVIRHFEKHMNDIEATTKKLELLESLLKMKKIQIIILSSRPFESLTKTEKDDPKTDISDRWLNVMNRFYTVFFRRNKSEGSGQDKPISDAWQVFRSHCMNQVNEAFSRPEKEKKSKTIQKVKIYLAAQIDSFVNKLEDEFTMSDFLSGIRKSIVISIATNKLMDFDFQKNTESHMIKVISRKFKTLHEEICLKIQSVAVNYYQATWHSLNHDEQKTLYDVALDEMVNPANRDIATRLYNLGLIRSLSSSGYEVISKSFRNFIFTQLDKKEVSNIQAEAAEKGTWSSVQLPVLITLIALSVFLFTTQKDSFTSLVTYLGAAGGGVLALLKVLGMVPSSK